MRCSECNERNSVAAKACRSCGHKFQAKPVPKSLMIGAAVCGGIILIGGIVAAVAPTLSDPSRALSRVAKKVAAGSSDANESKKSTAELDEAIKNFLKTNGTLPTPELAKKLQDGLSESAFEVHTFDLPRGLTVVEVDTMLQATDYLLLKNGANVKVTALPGMEVFDSGKIITDSSAPVLVMLGHTAGQGVHKPLIRAYALLPDDTVDQTSKTVPELKADGMAAFAKNNKDINLDYSFFSLGAGEKLFDASTPLPAGLSDDAVHGTMKWQNGKYEAQANSNRTQLSALYAMAKCIAIPAQSSRYLDLLGAAGTDFASSRKAPMAAPPEFKIFKLGSTEAEPSTGHSKRHPKPGIAATAQYLLVSKTESFDVQLSQSGHAGGWIVNGVKLMPQEDAQKIASSQTSSPLAAAETATTTDTTTSTTTTTSTGAPIIDASSPTPSDLSDKALKESKEQLKAVLDSTKELNKDSKDKTKDKDGDDKSKDSSKVAMSDISADTASGASSKDKNSKDKKSESKDDSGIDQLSTSEDKQTGVAASVHNQIDASQVRVRSGPGPNYKPLTTISRGSKLTVIGKSNGWYKIKANGQIGFIYGGLVDYKTPDAYETITVHKNEGLTDEHEKPVGSSKPGDRLVVLGSEKNGKVKVQLSSGQTAYINKNAVEGLQDTPQFVP